MKERLHHRSLAQLALLWSLSMLLFPLLLIQGAMVRRTALRLPDGEPPENGEFGEGQPALRVLGLGDSVIAGTGVPSMRDSVTARVAEVIAEQRGRCVAWLAKGCNGDRLADLVEKLREPPPVSTDILVVSIGVNDVTALTGLLRWQVQLTELLPLLRETGAGRIVLLGVPPMEYFTALPQPLRWVMGVRAAMLDKGLQQLASLIEEVTWVDVGISFDSAHLAEDGYHPNAKATREMAEQIVEIIQ